MLRNVDTLFGKTWLGRESEVIALLRIFSLQKIKKKTVLR